MKRGLLIVCLLLFLSPAAVADELPPGELPVLETDLTGDGVSETLSLSFFKPSGPGIPAEAPFVAELVVSDKTRGKIASVLFDAPTELTPEGMPVYPDSVKLERLPEQHFQPLISVIRVDFPLYACGVPGGAVYFTWDGKQITHAFTTSRMSEAGLFHVEDEVVFPPKSGKSDLVLVKTIHSEWDEKKEDYRVTHTDTVKYQWDGTRFLLSPSGSKPQR